MNQDLHDRVRLVGAGMHDTHHRVIVSPGYGKFVANAEDGHIVESGAVVAQVESSSKCVPILSPCRARVAGVLVCDGDRVQPGKALIHLEAL